MREDTKAFLRFFFAGIVAILGYSGAHYYCLDYPAIKSNPMLLVAAIGAAILGTIVAFKNFHLDFLFEDVWVDEEDDEEYWEW